VSPQLFPDRANHSTHPHVITIGNFDGVHRGHRYLMEIVVSDARELGARSAVLTFDPLPLEVLRPDVSLPRLTSTADRMALIRATGIDEVVPIRFSREIAWLEADEFVRQVVDAFHPAEIAVGADFAFGHNRSGNPELLRRLGHEHGYTLRVIDRIGDDETDFSSSRVRACLQTGDVRSAAEVLGRPYFIRGRVTEGQRRGRELGFPTANLSILGNVAIPEDGIYAAVTQPRPRSEPVPSMVYIGTNPTFDDHSRAVEVNLIDFDDDLYGAELTVLFADRVRGDQRFESAQALIDQMHRDQEATVRVLGGLGDDWQGDALREILEIGKGALTGDR
jgi:riboflavin kinase/FMN adenylyltransferase